MTLSVPISSMEADVLSLIQIAEHICPFYLNVKQELICEVKIMHDCVVSYFKLNNLGREI
jgi:hypothetical protein